MVYSISNFPIYLIFSRDLDDEGGNSFFFMSEHDYDNASVQYTLPTLILGEDVDDFTTVPKSHIEGLWREFRFPDGYAPRSVRYGDEFDIGHYVDQFVIFQDNNRETAKKAQDQCKRERASSKASVPIDKANVSIE